MYGLADHGCRPVTVPMAARTAHRSTAEFDTAVAPLMQPLLGYFTRRVTPQEDAADCLAETLVVLWRRRKDRPTDPDQLRAWSYGIAKGVLANHQRSQLRHVRLSFRLREHLRTATPPAGLDDNLSAALQELTAENRELVLLVAWDGFGVAEAGHLLGLTPDAARARYSRARRTLREALS